MIATHTVHLGKAPFSVAAFHSWDSSTCPASLPDVRNRALCNSMSDIPLSRETPLDAWPSQALLGEWCLNSVHSPNVNYPKHRAAHSNRNEQDAAWPPTPDPNLFLGNKKRVYSTKSKTVGSHSRKRRGYNAVGTPLQVFRYTCFLGVWIAPDCQCTGPQYLSSPCQHHTDIQASHVTDGSRVLALTASGVAPGR